MREISGDILEIKHGIICHQVNLKGVAGAGLARDLGLKFPDWKEHYKKVTPNYKLGDIDLYTVSKHILIASMYSQDSYGRSRRHTDYDAFYKCLFSLTARTCEKDLVFPFGIGCGLGGGDWEKISEMLETFFPSATLVKKDTVVINKILGY